MSNVVCKICKAKRKRGEPAKHLYTCERFPGSKRDPLRNNPIVGNMSEAEAERLLVEMRRH